MKLTTKGRYAVTAMLHLAMNAKEKPVSLADISQMQAISLSYLEQLFAKLRRHELVDSIRGPGGGYQLGAPAGQITIASVIDAVSESTDLTACGGKANCQEGKQCITHDLWSQLSQQIHNYLSEITLQQVIDQYVANDQLTNQPMQEALDPVMAPVNENDNTIQVSQL